MAAPTNLNRASAMLGLPQAPADMSAADKATWNAIVTSRPASTWTPADVVLLRLYMSTVADVQRLDREIDRRGEVEAGKVSPLVKIRDMRETKMIQVAMRLKLCPSNRYSGETVARLGHHAAKARASAAVFDADADEDDLLGGHPSGKGKLQ